MSKITPRSRISESKLTIHPEHLKDMNNRISEEDAKGLNAKKALKRKELEEKEEEDIDKKLDDFLTGTSCAFFYPPTDEEIAAEKRAELDGVKRAIAVSEAELDEVRKKIALSEAELQGDDLIQYRKKEEELKINLEAIKKHNPDWNK